MTSFTRGQRVRIIATPTTTTPLHAGREGEYLGPACCRGKPQPDAVTVCLDSGIPAYDFQVTLSPRDLEAVR